MNVIERRVKLWYGTKKRTMRGSATCLRRLHLKPASSEKNTSKNPAREGKVSHEKNITF